MLTTNVFNLYTMTSIIIIIITRIIKYPYYYCNLLMPMPIMYAIPMIPSFLRLKTIQTTYHTLDSFDRTVAILLISSNMLFRISFVASLKCSSNSSIIYWHWQSCWCCLFQWRCHVHRSVEYI